MKPSIAFRILALLVVAGAGSVVRAQYTAYDLGYGSANDINNANTIVGFSGLPGGATPQRAFIYSGGTKTLLGTLGGSYSIAYGINNAGAVVGTSGDSATGYPHGFVYSGGVMSDIGTLESYGYHTYAYAINDAGTIVGESQTYVQLSQSIAEPRHLIGVGSRLFVDFENDPVGGSHIMNPLQ